jgi:glycosyltransferase involved in cell wall biosynthesis
MKVALVGTELTPVVDGAGGLEHLLLGWGRLLSSRFDVTIASVGEARCQGPTKSACATEILLDPTELTVMARHFDLVILNNRPAWLRFVDNGAVLFHNYPGPAWADTTSRGVEGSVEDRLSEARGIGAVSHALAAAIESAFPESNVRIVEPFAASEFFDWVRPAHRVRRPRIVYPNRLLRKKGIEIALEAKRTIKDLDGIEFSFTDFIEPWSHPTSEHIALREQVRATPECSLIYPRRTRSEMARLLALSSAVAIPSTEPEAFGLCSIEAQAAWTRSIVSDAGGLPETVSSASWTFRLGSPDALADAVVKALDAPRLCAAEHCWIVDRFSPKSSAARLADFIEKAAAA